MMATAKLPLMGSASANFGRAPKRAFDEDDGSLARVVKWRNSTHLNARGFRALCAPMVRTVVLALMLGSAPLAAQPTPASLKQAPGALSLFERDWVLMNWALKFYDKDRDILLEPAEAQAAAAEFRKIADADGDGRITPYEYRQAREFILARY
jgi:hypothetical protein